MLAIGAKRRAGAEPGAAPKWLIARQARYRQRFPLRDYYDVPMQRGSALSLSKVGATYRDATPEQRKLRKHMMMTGKGLYRGRGGFFGRALGNLFGMGDLGDKIGDAAWGVAKNFIPEDYANLGDAAFKITDKLGGQGLYRGMRGRGIYAANNLIMDSGAQASNVVPQFHPSDMHTITYSNREYVRDIFAPAVGTVFELQSWELNPGLPTSFPWLSQLAINFEEYELVQLAYTFKSTISDFAAASGQVGQVLMATQYNPDSDTFATKDEMMLYEGGMSCKTTETMIHGVECDPKKLAGSSNKYVRVGGLPPQEDKKNYDLGRTSLAVVNAPATYANQQIGELWVSYTIVLRKPKIASGNAYNVGRDIYVTPSITYSGSGPIATYGSLLSGSRNSLGTQLQILNKNLLTGSGTDALTEFDAAENTATSVEQFRITLPSSYSGVLALRWIVKSNNQTPPLPVLVSLAPSTISRFKDIPVGYNNAQGATLTQTWVHQIRTAGDAYLTSTGGLFGSQSDVTMHLRVHPPSAGLPNIILFGTRSPFASNEDYQWVLEISQLNTFLSVQDNGSNDRIDLVQTFSGQSAVFA